MEKAIIVTGGSRGIGLETCRIILKRDNTGVLATGRTRIGDSEELQELKAAFSDRFRYISIDHDREDAGKVVAEECLKVFGRIDGIVHSAGVLEPLGKLETIKIEDFKKMINVNLYSALDLIQQCLPQLRLSKGSIVLVSSGAATKAYPTWGAYCMSKSALNMLAMNIGVEEPSVATIALRPGVVDTEMQRLIRVQGQDLMPPSLHEYFVSMKNDGKLLPPSAPATVIAELAIRPHFHLSGQFLSWDKVPGLAV